MSSKTRWTNWTSGGARNFEGVQVLAAQAANLSAFFKCPDYERTAIYTTNALGAVHREFRTLTETKRRFANENSLLKLAYAGVLTATGRRRHPIQNWNLMLPQLTNHCLECLDDYISR